MKRRSLTVLLCLLAIISLASVGFASWVISAGDDVEATGNIQVETVTDQRLKIEFTNNPESQSFNLLAPAAKDQTNDKAWLTAPETAGEVKEVTLSFTVKYKNQEGTPNANVTVAWDQLTAAKLAEAVELGYIAKVPTTENDGIVITKGDNGSYTAKIKFEWGSLFGGENPYTYYNADKKGANDKIYVGNDSETGARIVKTSAETGLTESTWADEAMLQLRALYEFFTVTGESEGVKAPFTYGIVITATPDAQSN